VEKVKDTPTAPTTVPPAPRRCGGWLFNLERFPEQWRCPAGSFWIAGWIVSSDAHVAADMRVQLGTQRFFGLCGLPRPDVETQVSGKEGPPHAGFCFLLQAPPKADELTIEVCDESGVWHEILRQTVSCAPSSAPAPAPAPLSAEQHAEAILRLLRGSRDSRRKRSRELLAQLRSLPLDSLPNPPFFGRLELPTGRGHVRHGLLEVSGWLAHRLQGVTSLIAFIDPAAPVKLQHRLPRTDVTALFDGLKDEVHSQFRGYISVPAQLPEPLCLRIVAQLDDGRRELVFARRFKRLVADQSRDPLPSFSLLRFAAAALAWRVEVRPPGPEFHHGWRIARDDYRALAPCSTRAPRAISRPGGPTRPVNVVVVTHNLNREGAPLIALEHATFLASQPGWNVRVVSPHDGPLRALFGAAGVPLEIIAGEELWNAKTAEEFDAALDRLAAHPCWHGVELIIANTVMSFWAVPLAQKLGWPSLLYIHESTAARRFFSSLLARPVIPEVERALGTAHRVVFSAAAVGAVHAGHQRRGNFLVLPGWVDAQAIAAFSAKHTAAELRRAHGFPDDAVIFVNVGSVSERKGQLVFVQAIDRWREARNAAGQSTPPLIFLMVGASPGPFAEFVRFEVSQRGLEGVQIVEKVADVFPYYRLSDVFVCSSFEEALPRVVLEAAAFGLPIVSTDVNGIPEILGRDDAWLVPAGDAGQLANAMDAALQAHLSGDRSRAERARASVLRRFDSAVLLPQHAALAANAAEAR
jgi:glycosyltransferase involved in cell wall biosynthesis